MSRRYTGIILPIILVLLFSSVWTTTSNNDFQYSSESKVVRERSSTRSYVPHDAILIVGDTQLNETAVSEGWLGNGSVGNPFIITGYSIDVDNESALEIQNTTLHLLVENCFFSGSLVSLDIGNVSHCTIKSVECTTMSGSHSAIRVDTCEDMRINDIIVRNCGTGLGIVDVTNSELDNVTCFKTHDGVLLMGTENITVTNSVVYSCEQSGFDIYSDNTTFENITCYDNGWAFTISQSGNLTLRNIDCSPSRYSTSYQGISCFDVGDSLFSNITCNLLEEGFQLDACFDNTIENLTVISAYRGFVMTGSAHHNLVTNSTIAFCRYGPLVYGTLNDFYNNYIIQNIWGQVIDEGSDNYWDDGVSIGNFWSDFSGEGIYLIPGSANSIDHYPLTEYPFGPLLNQPDNMTVTGINAIHWRAFDTNPSHYEVYVDGSRRDDSTWDGGHIYAVIENLTTGTHNFTVLVQDLSGEINSDTVFVLALEEIPIYTMYGLIPRLPLYLGSLEYIEFWEIPGTGTAEDPFRIEDYYFLVDSNDEDTGLELSNLNSFHVLVQNCYFPGSRLDNGSTYYYDCGIHLFNCSNVIITNCTFYDLHDGIYASHCTDNIIENCTFVGDDIDEPSEDDTDGISLFLCNGMRIENNTVTFCTRGITLLETSETEILINSVTNGETGLLIEAFCEENFISSNTFQNLTSEGIFVMSSSRNLISNNTFAYNRNRGLYLDPESTENIVTDNYFVDNGVNAEDDGTGNSFDYNYWSDYEGVDADSDGYGDTPYSVPGDAASSDPHPRGTLSPSTTTDTGVSLNPLIPIVTFGSIAVVVVVGVYMVGRRPKSG